MDNLYKIGVDTKSKTIEVGKPELPIYSFSYGLDPEKEYSIKELAENIKEALIIEKKLNSIQNLVMVNIEKMFPIKNY